MKIWFLCFSFFVSQIVLGAPCNGASGKNHTNPDGSQGGFVANTAQVARTVFVDASSSVCEQAKIQGNVKVSTGSVISGQASIEGTSQIVSSVIKGNAKVFGRAAVYSSAVCQQSEVNFKVSDSNYYCSIYEPEPKDPGELGRKTLAGIDGNVNGVRDDVEIWINNNTTNTPNKNLAPVRERLIKAAKSLGQSIILAESGSAAKGYLRQADRELFCVTSLKDKLLSVLSAKLRVATYNTKARLDAWIKVQSTFVGEDAEDFSGYCD